MTINSLPSERVAVLATIDPDAYTPGEQTSDWANMAYFETLMCVVCVGTIGTLGYLDVKLQQATSAAGAGAKDITGKAITRLTQAGTDSDKQAIINLRAEELDVDGGFQYVAAVAVSDNTGSPSEAGVDYGVTLFGMDARYGPASDNDIASVDEIVA